MAELVLERNTMHNGPTLSELDSDRNRPAATTAVTPGGLVGYLLILLATLMVASAPQPAVAVGVGSAILTITAASARESLGGGHTVNRQVAEGRLGRETWRNLPRRQT